MNLCKDARIIDIGGSQGASTKTIPHLSAPGKTSFFAALKGKPSNIVSLKGENHNK